MQKNIITTILVCAASLGLTACNNSNNDKANLPKEAQLFLSEQFASKQISLIEETKNQMDYNVTLDDGTEIEFNHLGGWEEINFKRNDVPKSFLSLIPSEMVQYIQSNYADETIHKIQRKTFGRRQFIYRVEFNKPNDIELNFTQNGKIISDDPSGKTLPSNATVFLKNHFSNVAITSIVNDVDGDYDVILEQGSEISFDRKGNWYYIKNAQKEELPSSVLGLLPSNIQKYIDKNYPTQSIRRIEKKGYGYRVKLNKPNNIEITFTKTGEFLEAESKGNSTVATEE